MARPMFIDFNLDELYYYPFIISKKRCDRRCNTVENPFGRICITSKIDKGINDSKKLLKHITCECRCEFDGRKCDSRQKLKNDKCQCDCENIVHAKKIMFGIIEHMLASVIRIVILVNTCNTVNA